MQDPQNRHFLFETTQADRDCMNLGLAVSMVLPSGLQPFLNFRDMLAYQDRNTYTVTACAYPFNWGPSKGPPIAPSAARRTMPLGLGKAQR